jgi:hypothetical protein
MKLIGRVPSPQYVNSVSKTRRLRLRALNSPIINAPYTLSFEGLHQQYCLARIKGK